MRGFRLGTSSLVIAGFFLLFPPLQARPAAQPGQPDRFEQWLTAIEAHEPGGFGKNTLDLSTWSGTDLEAAVAEAVRHARALAKKDPEQANRMLLRGAALHGDIARLIPQESIRRSPSQQAVYTIKDGRWQGVRFLTMHWQLARTLLDGVFPTPAVDPGVLAWYRESSRDLLKARSLSEAIPHLTRALQLCPKDSPLLFYRGVLHERLSSPLIQAGSDSLVEDNRGASVPSAPRMELGRAERLFRDALVEQPDHLEARLRHGRVLGDLGQHDQAISELRHAVADGADGRLLYYAHLFLAKNYEALGAYADARRELERAATLYPRAQTPTLALSRIWLRTGNRADAQRELLRLASLPEDEREREDPWWDYYDLR